MKVGIQLYSVKEHLMKDGLGTIKKVADTGYKYIETFASERFATGEAEKGYGLGLTLSEAKTLLDDTGLTIVGSHYHGFDNPAFEGMCEYFASLGSKQIGCSGGFWVTSLDELLQKIQQMCRHAEIAKQYGLRYYYHNHFWEFQKFGGKTFWHIVQDETDPDLIYFEMDNYWAARGGADPVKEAERLGDRLILMHQKDFSKTAGEPINLFEERIDINQPINLEVHLANRHVGTFAEVGNGVLPIQDFIDAGNKCGVEYILLEQDLTAIDEFDSIRISMEAFKKFSGISWD